MTDFGIYIHFPYCAQRCPYCDFAIAVRRTVRHQRYLDAVRAELLAKAPLYPQRQLGSVYFGGGTPSLWRPDCIAQALAAALAAFPPPPGVVPEVTLECDPAGLSSETLGELRQAGINRLSIGAQSFDRRQLQVLGRRHSPEQIPSVVAAARQAGFDNISVDLMIGLLGQRLAELDGDLDQLLALAPSHVSLYQLTIEPRTPFGARVRRGELRPPDPELQTAGYQRVCARLAGAGYEQYEISNFARQSPTRSWRSRHNTIYWTGGEYLGLGLGAHSFRRLVQGGGERFANQRGVDNYLAQWGPSSDASGAVAPWLPAATASGLSLYEQHQPDALAREAIWLGLRRLDGVSCRQFVAQYGVDPRQIFADSVAAMQKRGWLDLDGDTLRLSAAGLLFADEVGAAFL